MSKNFTAEELRGYILNKETIIIHDNSGDTHSPDDEGLTTSVFRADDGKLYRASWVYNFNADFNSFEDQSCDEVFPQKKLKVHVNTEYVTLAEDTATFELSASALQASALISDDAEASLSAIQAFDTDTVLEFMKDAQGAILVPKYANFLETSRQFFEAVKKVQEELSNES